MYSLVFISNHIPCDVVQTKLDFLSADNLLRNVLYILTAQGALQQASSSVLRWQILLCLLACKAQVCVHIKHAALGAFGPLKCACFLQACMFFIT